MKVKLLIKTITGSKLAVPVFLLVICVLAYGLLTPTLGYYWDDWPYAWINHMFGPGGYPDFVALDRPHSAWVFVGLTALYGEQPLGYQINGVLMYWFCAVLFWVLLRMLWPQEEDAALWAGILFAVYPGFVGHPNAIIFNHHFAAMALAFFSFIGMILAIRRPGRGWWWHIPAVLALILSQFSIEYYLGWEAVRPLVIWLALRERGFGVRQRLGMGIRHLAPYWTATVGFLAWRVLVFAFPTYQPVTAGEDLYVREWVAEAVRGVWEVVVGAWARVLPWVSRADFSRTVKLVALALSFGTAVFVFVVLIIFRPEKDPDQGDDRPRGFGWIALLIVLVGISFAGLPFLLTDLRISIEGYLSRFSLPFIPWAALLAALALRQLARLPLRRRWVLPALLVSLLAGGAAGWHFQNANLFRNDWLEMERYFQQLTTRAPDLEPGTTILINDMPFLDHYSDNSLTAVLNWAYAPEKADTEMDYMVYYLSVRLGLGLPALEPGLPIEQPYRSLHFSGSTDQLLVVYYMPPGCVRVMDLAQGDRLPAGFPSEMIPALSLSDLSLVDPDATPPEDLPSKLTMPETQTWCLYFEAAERAAQQGDWARVAQLGDEAFAGQDLSNDPTEILVFIEGYLRDDQPMQALTISRSVSERTRGFLDPTLCTIWQKAAAEQPGAFDPAEAIGLFCDD
jgi:hypothetical protein